MASGTSDNGSEECIDNICCVCIQKGTTMGATKYCVECMDYYCLSCAHMHMCFPALKGHTLFDECQYKGLDSMPTLPSLLTEKCSSHDAKHLEVYCEDHDEVVCATCVTFHHRSCKKLHSIPNEISSLYDETGAEQTTNQLLSDKKELKDEIEDSKQILHELKERKKLAIDCISDYKADLVAEINKLAEDSLKQVDEQYAITENHLQNAIKEAEGSINDIEQSIDKLEHSEEKAQHFVFVKTARKNISRAKMSKELLKELSDVKIPTFCPQLKIKKYIQQTKSLGKLCNKEDSKEIRNTLYTVTKQWELCAKISTDRKACRIFSVCLTDEGFLLLADHNNENLKRLDVSTDMIKDHLSLEAAPNAVWEINRNEAAVSLSNKSIQYISLGDKMTVTRVIKMDHYCSGLAYMDGELFITDGSSVLCMFDGDKTFMQKRLAEKSGELILGKARHLSLGANEEVVHVADIDRGLINLDIQGNYVSTYIDSDSAETRGVCIDGKGSIFVCGYKSDCIVQLTENTNTKLGTIKSKPLQLSVCFDPNNTKLFVTHDGSDTIQVFDLQ